VTLIKLQKVWGIGLFLHRQQLITLLGVNGEFASGIAWDTAGKLLSAGGAMDISRRWSEAQAPEIRRQ
jgi:hypothetical protein